jgi:glycosyltransferase involved in cell wall biosynthesis
MSENRNPKLSVVLPAFNAEKTIGRAIESVLQQKYYDFELIVIDDGSTDETGRRIEAFRDARIRVHRFEKNKGLIAGLNKGLELARGHYIARQDADDQSVPQRFARQVVALDKNLNLGVVGSCMRLRNSENRLCGVYSYPSKPALAKWQVLFKTPVAHSTVMLRRSVIERVGGYDQSYKFAEDYELWTRISEVSSILSLKEKLVYYNIGNGGVSEKNRVAQDEIHTAISSQNIEKLTGKQLDSNIVRAISLSVDRYKEKVEAVVVEQSIAALIDLRGVYLRRGISAWDARIVDQDTAWRIASLIRKLEYRKRISNVRQVLRHTNFGLAPTLKIASVVLPRNV